MAGVVRVWNTLVKPCTSFCVVVVLLRRQALSMSLFGLDLLSRWTSNSQRSAHLPPGTGIKMCATTSLLCSVNEASSTRVTWMVARRASDPGGLHPSIETPPLANQPKEKLPSADQPKSNVHRADPFRPLRTQTWLCLSTFQKGGECPGWTQPHLLRLWATSEDTDLLKYTDTS